MLEDASNSVSLRAKALRKLSQFYMDPPSPKDVLNPGLDAITHSLPIFYSTNSSKIYTIPLTLSEWEIISSLSSTIPNNVKHAEKLLYDVVSLYFLEAPRQRISDVLLAKFRIYDFKNPSAVLTFELTKFLITISNKFPELSVKCANLIEDYLLTVKKLFLSKQSSLFSLLGFIDAFIDDNSASSLMQFVWNKLSNLFSHDSFIVQIETLLSSSTSFANDAIVQYFDAGVEISGPLFIERLATFQVCLVSKLLQLPSNSTLLAEYLLNEQCSMYNHQQEPISSEKSLTVNGSSVPLMTDFLCKVQDSVPFFVDMSKFSLSLYLSIETSCNLSSDSRAKYSFNARAKLLELLCIIPFLDEKSSELFTHFVETTRQAMEYYLLSDVITPKLTKSIVAAASLLNFFTEELSELLLRDFSLLVGSIHMTQSAIVDISEIFTISLQPLNEDAIVSTIYSINNVLTSIDDGTSPNVMMRGRQLTMTSNNSGSLLKLETSGNATNGPKNTDGKRSRSVPKSGQHTSQNEALLENCVSAIATIATHYKNQTITALTVSILTQKVTTGSKFLNKVILNSLARLVPSMSLNEFSLLTKFMKVTKAMADKQHDGDLATAILASKNIISEELLIKNFNSSLYKSHLSGLLESIIASGEVDRLDHHRPHMEISRVAEQIIPYLPPLASLLPQPGSTPLDLSCDEEITNLFRNMWFNLVIHGFYYNSDLVKENFNNLVIIAYNSPPLASDFPANNKEMSLEMNTVLSRGTSNSNVKAQKQLVQEYLNINAVQSRTTSNSKIMFLAATLLLESIRCEAGDCSKILLYLSDPSLSSSTTEKSLVAIALSKISEYIKMTNSGNAKIFNAKLIAEQLNNIFLCLVHRVPSLQDAAFQCCEFFIKSIPSSLCHHTSLFTLLDLMTTMFDSIVDCETNRFEPHYEFKLKHSATQVVFPASKEWRASTLSRLHKAAKGWVTFVLNRSNEDTKILLQSYISDISQFNRKNNVEFGVSFAIQMAGSIISADKELSRITYNGPERPNTISGFISQHSWRSKYLVDTAISSSPESISQELEELRDAMKMRLKTKEYVPDKTIIDFLDLSVAMLILGGADYSYLIYDIVHVPFEVFTSPTLKTATNIWLTIIKERPELSHNLLVEVSYCWMRSIDENRGLYCRESDLTDVEYQMMEYTPYNKKAINRDARTASKSLQPHRHIIKFFTSHFQGTLFQSKYLLKIFTQTALYGISNLKKASLHPFARMIRNELLVFGLNVLTANFKQNSRYVDKLGKEIIAGGLSWFKNPVSWPFGSNELKVRTDLSIMLDLYSKLDSMSKLMIQITGKEFALFKYFLASEIQQIETWLAPLSKISGADSNELPSDMLGVAFNNDPRLAVNIVQRYSSKKLRQALISLVSQKPLLCAGVPRALDSFLIGMANSSTKTALHAVLYWAPVSPLKSINLFLPEWNANSFILQYSIFSLESHDVNVTFFYVPQIVQCLRYDRSGYVEKLILDTAKISVLFSHQIIWNMLANSYKGDEGVIEDEIKPRLDHVRKMMLSTFSKSHYGFYKKEFDFFNEVTGISGKLKPFIKKSKAEKKQKIDEEMSVIKIKPDVYLPSNPDGVVIDIDRKSGKPLQSHAKAPFMATFKIKKEILDSDTGEKKEIEKWQSAIFKVGDDCRQDVLALQLISLFRSIWSNIGLDVYVFPYRVTATAPGCGVIDVLPNSISRDMLGREAVNGLYEYFISKFGPEDTIEFQNARSNFVKSLAGYSVISYLLQFKDRHNGNIMYDDEGHCLHIDFGFIFDIVPGGVKFEAVPFKLTKEMVKVMGGSNQTAAYYDFEELCIKAYLAARPHMDAIIECIEPMLGSGLPCFKGAKTIKNLQTRFQPQKTDHEAALYMKGLIKKSFESMFTKGYDEFQRLTNGIPY
ncbi:hypothetical protein KAFR_0F03050 [Kazachstania africana CBS 2517]|uniref:1-phosphatidylinositol 4-kinase n=1 Tax=Kazachstania africana (strain ATCC 22294 / BCRC 22015 / CBS 2517 / CECT 1963 / NBRC 1671 / NRRL Y-8276) TaxID=1071382 RepID=H2AX01_KAZAF|nr:hypothetical protein KAFR_0F03050 [Kazachstania africana CBS 2517]CCF58901.1 hypothetical protein KAFR_0F03050 [Kazachstania africana CBS 2517]